MDSNLLFHTIECSQAQSEMPIGLICVILFNQYVIRMPLKTSPMQTRDKTHIFRLENSLWNVNGTVSNVIEYLGVLAS